MNTTTTLESQTISSEKSRAILTAAILGVLLYAIIGFAPSTQIHNAAHDSRHGLGFPCH